MRITSEELGELRRAQLKVQSLALTAQSAKAALDTLMFDIEEKYHLIGKNVTLNIQTGEITPPSDTQAEQRDSE